MNRFMVIAITAAFFISVLAWGLIDSIQSEPTNDVTIEQPTPEVFEPITINDIKVPDIIVIGQRAKITNGLCNTSDTDVSVQVVLLAQNVENSRVSFRLIPEEGAPADFETVFVPAGLCVAETVFDDVVPPILAPGRWFLGARVTVIGNAEQRQVEEATSNIFTIEAGQ
jgi:hypothetical protein